MASSAIEEVAARSERTCMCGSTSRSWFPSSFTSPSTMITQCLLRTSPLKRPGENGATAVSEEPRKKSGPARPLRPPNYKDLKVVVDVEDSDAKDAAMQEDVVSTSAGSSDIGKLSDQIADSAGDEKSEVSSSSSDLAPAAGLPVIAEIAEIASAALAAVEVKQPEKPNFAGTWHLARTEGDLDRFLTDMGQGWLVRNGAKALKYGVGRVVVECKQDGDNLQFMKVLCDPRNLSKSKVQVVVGQGSVRFLDDIGRLCSTSCWSDDFASLRFDAKLESSGLAVTLLMYYNEAGNFVEEMISCKGTVAKYIFERKA